MNKVYVTGRIPPENFARLSAAAEIGINDSDRLSRDTLLEGVRGCDAIVALLGARIDGEVLDAAGPQLRIVANFAVGYDNLDVAAATERGVILTNTPGVLDDATAGLAFALMLATARRLAEGDRYIRAGQWTGAWSPGFFLGQDMEGATLGIVGAGRIGRNLARKARGFDMRLLYTGRQRRPDFESETGAVFAEKGELLARSDFVSLHVPLSAETHHYIGAAELAAMKPNAILINTSRGPIVDEEALVEALRAGRIWGAGLDVFENEPRLASGLAELDNVVLVPHIGSATPRTRRAMGDLAIDNVLKVLAGEPPLTCVNPDVLDRRR